MDKINETSCSFVHVGEELVPDNISEFYNDPLRLHRALSTENFDKIRELVKENNGQLIFVCDDKKQTPLHIIASQGEDFAIKKLEICMQPDGEDSNFIKTGKIKTVLSWEDNNGMTPLDVAAKNCNPSLVRQLLSYGSDPTKVGGRDRNSALHYVAESDTKKAIETAKVLLEYSEHPEEILCLPNSFLSTPFHIAVSFKCANLVEHMLKYTFDKTRRDNMGRNVLHHICRQRENARTVHIFEMLLPHFQREDVIAIENNGQNALHMTAENQSCQMLEVLLLTGHFNVRARESRRGRTCLHYALSYEHPIGNNKCFELLAQVKFKTPRENIDFLFNDEDNNGLTPFKMACKNCCQQTVERYLDLLPLSCGWLTDNVMNTMYTDVPSALSSFLCKGLISVGIDGSRTPACQVDYRCIVGSKDPYAHPMTQETKYLFKSIWWDESAKHEVYSHPIVEMFFAKKFHRNRSWLMGLMVMQLISLYSHVAIFLCTFFGQQYGQFAHIIATVMIVYTSLNCATEVVHIIDQNNKYFTQPANILRLLEIGVNIFLIVAVLGGGDLGLLNSYSSGAGVAILQLSFLYWMAKINQHLCSQFISMKNGIHQILGLALSYSPITFAIVFWLILSPRHPILQDADIILRNSTLYIDQSSHLETSPALYVLLWLFVIRVWLDTITSFTTVGEITLADHTKVYQSQLLMEYWYRIDTVFMIVAILTGRLGVGSITQTLQKYNVTSTKCDNVTKFQPSSAEKLTPSYKEWVAIDAILYDAYNSEVIQLSAKTMKKLEEIMAITRDN